jgi:hypothetical protein
VVCACIAVNPIIAGTANKMRLFKLISLFYDFVSYTNLLIKMIPSTIQIPIDC